MASRWTPLQLTGLLGLVLSCSQESPPAEKAKFEARAQRSVSGYGSESLEHFRAPGMLQTDSFQGRIENDLHRAADQPLSTFSIDVDTASYAVVRRFLVEGRRPPEGAVRVEELINYFPYEYPEPAPDLPFSVTTETAAAPWSPGHRLVRIGLRAPAPDALEPRPDNLVFLIDVSGSMQGPDRLPLLVRSLQLLTEQLDRDDTVSIVVYAGSEGLALPPTKGDRKSDIVAALQELQAGGSTDGGAGIDLAYRVAREHFVRGGNNRVILCTDGDFNVGVSSPDALVRKVEAGAKAGVFLTVLGFGLGNYKDSTVEQLADRGNGNYAYIDSIAEARKALVEQLGGTLRAVAKDVKIQVEWNPAAVEAYRLIGYENRLLDARDFNDDTKDAGEIGAGHTVTALYEVVPAGAESGVPPIDPLKYSKVRTGAAGSSELATVKLRYKEPEGEKSLKLEHVVFDTGGPIERASEDLRFVSAVAVFGMRLTDSKHAGSASFDMARDLAQSSLGRDPQGYRREFVELVGRARDVVAHTDGTELHGGE
jgi:Ca-activated chloride channel family protein